jgi:anti-sigma factor RsiW
MDCRDFKKLISRELDGEIGDTDLTELGRHIESCEECREFKAALARTFSVHRGLRDAAAPTSIVPAVLAAIEREESVPRVPWWRRIAVPAAAALVLITGALSGNYLVDAFVTTNGEATAETLELDYFEEYPPGSVGDMLIAAAEGGGDEQ